MITWNAFVMAVMMVESSGNDKAIGDNGASHGPLQIQKDCVDDANRYRRREGLPPLRFPQDCYDRRKAELIMIAYLKEYTLPRCKKSHKPAIGIDMNDPKVREKHYWRTGKRPTIEDYARIWNGGPNGYKIQATVKYWNKVKKELED